MSLPDGWVREPLVRHIEFPQGQVDPRRSPYRDWPLIAPDHIESTTGRLLLIQTAAEQNAISGKYAFRSGDVLYSKIRPSLRKATLAGFEGLCSADMYPLRPKPSLDPRFLLALILGEEFSRFADAVSMRSGFPKINREEFAEHEAILPPIDEQRRIADVLDAIDAAIRQTEGVIAKLREIKAGLMHDLLTRGLDEQGRLRNGRYSDVTFRDYTLGELFTPRREPGMPGLPVVSVTLYDGLIPRDPNERRVESRLSAQQHLLARKGDIAYNMMRMWQGACGVATEDCLLSPAYVVLKPNDRIDSAFAYLLFKSPEVIRRFHSQSRGLTDDRLRLYYHDFSKITVTVPVSVDEQRRLVTPYTDLLSRVETEEQVVAKLKLQKRGLMNDLLTGRVRV